MKHKVLIRAREEVAGLGRLVSSTLGYMLTVQAIDERDIVGRRDDLILGMVEVRHFLDAVDMASKRHALFEVQKIWRAEADFQFIFVASREKGASLSRHGTSRDLQRILSDGFPAEPHFRFGDVTLAPRHLGMGIAPAREGMVQ